MRKTINAIVVGEQSELRYICNGCDEEMDEGWLVHATASAPWLAWCPDCYAAVGPRGVSEWPVGFANRLPSMIAKQLDFFERERTSSSRRGWPT